MKYNKILGEALKMFWSLNPTELTPTTKRKKTEFYLPKKRTIDMLKSEQYIICI